MGPLVSLQSISTEEALVTLCAGVRTHPSVIAQVDGKIAGLGEPLPTVRTLKWLMSCMKALMLQKLSMGKEALPTIRAKEWPLARVCQLVSDERSLIYKTLITLRAAEDVFPGVAVLVLFHITLPLEALATEGAHEGHVL